MFITEIKHKRTNMMSNNNSLHQTLFLVASYMLGSGTKKQKLH